MSFLELLAGSILAWSVFLGLFKFFGLRGRFPTLSRDFTEYTVTLPVLRLSEFSTVVDAGFKLGTAADHSALACHSGQNVLLTRKSSLLLLPLIGQLQTLQGNNNSVFTVHYPNLLGRGGYIKHAMQKACVLLHIAFSHFEDMS